MNIFKKFFITDWAIISYVVFITIWTYIGKGVIETYPLLMAQYMGILFFVFIIVLINCYVKSPVIRFIRYCYPIALLEFFFTAATKIDLVLFNEYLDPIFMHLDERIFGYQPAVMWGTVLDAFIIQEFFHFAYFSYYLMIIGIPFYIYFQRGKVEYVRTLFNILFVFITCYVMYILLPVVGGRYIDGVIELTETYRHGLFTHIMVFIYRSSTHFGGAFPSSHVAIALTISMLSFRYFRGFSVLLLIMTFFLAISTVYCHYHYFVDALAGIIWGVVMFGLSEFLYSIFGFKKEKYIDD